MSRLNKCKECGETDVDLLVGSNRSLCKNCIVTCPHCNGRGRKYIALLGDRMCRICNGRGTTTKNAVLDYIRAQSEIDEERAPSGASVTAGLTLAMLAGVMPKDRLLSERDE